MAEETVRRRRRSAPEPVVEDKHTRVEFLDSGSLILNLAMSGRGRGGGWARGRVVNIVGDGSTGKTMLAVEGLFRAYNDVMGRPSELFPPVKKLIMVYANAEGVMDFPLEEMYGQEFVDAVEWWQPETCEAFGRDLFRRVENQKEGECLIYVADSIDAMIPKAALERTEKSIRQNKDEDGSYGTEKAKYFSNTFFRTLINKMGATEEHVGKDATIIMISQVREKIGVTFGEKLYRTGGMALNFYTHQVPWLRVAEKLKRTFRGEERVYGVEVHAKVKRSKVAKPYREANFVVLFDYGVDNIGSMLNYYFGPKKAVSWKKRTFTDRDEAVRFFENNRDEYEQLCREIETYWQEIEDAIKPQRAPKY